MQQLQQEDSFNSAKLYMWVKGLESKVNNLLKEVDVLKNDSIKKTAGLKKEIRSINEDLMELKHQQEKALQKMDIIIKELKQTAGAEEVMTLKKYVDLWSPLNFVTQRDVERLVENHVDRIHRVLKRAVNTQKKTVRKTARQRKARKKERSKKIKRKVIHHAN
ncbi:MAG TPA: hypothetical protein VJI98_03285 [Candidatus Nanoarchaeia archaeon]|nr:hypothetical protein [Candidatus Nanoarchaeia archaeon]